MSKNENQITIAKVQDEKKLVEVRIKTMLEAFQKENGVEIYGIDFCNDAVYSSGSNKPVDSDITVRLNVKL